MKQQKKSKERETIQNGKNIEKVEIKQCDFYINIDWYGNFLKKKIQ